MRIEIAETFNFQPVGGYKKTLLLTVGMACIYLLMFLINCTCIMEEKL